MSAFPCGIFFRASNRQSISPYVIAVAVLLATLATSPVTAQNRISTIAGAGSGIVEPSPLNADLPGPVAVVEDQSGNIYVAPPVSQYVFQLNKQTGTLVPFAGTGYITFHKMTQQATTSPLWNPSGLAKDAQGNIYIADTGNNAIREVDTSGNMSTIVGISKPCQGGNCGDNAPAVDAELNAPQAVALDSKGNIYVADTGDSRIRCVIMAVNGCGSKTGAKIGTIVNYAGTVGQPCTNPTSACGDGGKAHLANLNTPMGITFDRAGHLYIADTYDNRIREVGDQGVITTIAGTGVLCRAGTSKCGDGGLATKALLAAPRAVAVDAAYNVYIADTKDQRIRIVSGTTIGPFAGTGASGFAGDGGLPTAAQLTSPNGVFVNGEGYVFISDTGNQRVRIVIGGTTGKIATIMGSGNGGDGAAATGTYAMLAGSYQVAVDSSNNYYIADTANNRIRVVNTQASSIVVAGISILPGDIATVAGTGDAGYTGDNGLATAATLNSPYGLALDASGDIYIADTFNNVIREVDTAGTIITVPGARGLTAPSSLAFDKAGNLFIADPKENVVFELSGSTLSIVAGNGTAGHSGNGGPATSAELNAPFGIAVDAKENLYIADSNNNVIRCVIGTLGACWDTAQKYPVGTILPYAFNGGAVFQGDGGPALKATRWHANEVALDSAGTLFIGGGHNPLVQRVDQTTGTIVTVAGNDAQYWYYGYQGDGNFATLAHIDNIGLTIDSNENLLIADAGNNRIREVPMVGVATLKPKSLNFGKQKVGTQSAPRQVTLQNTGANDITFSNIQISANFSQSNNCPVAPAQLAPSNAAVPVVCTFTVYFTPTEKGTQTGSITIKDNAYLSPQVINLSGVGD
jgi:trimeric autotransporter adhesin